MPNQSLSPESITSSIGTGHPGVESAKYQILVGKDSHVVTKFKSLKYRVGGEVLQSNRLSHAHTHFASRTAHSYLSATQHSISRNFRKPYNFLPLLFPFLHSPTLLGHNARYQFSSLQIKTSTRSPFDLNWLIYPNPFC